MGTGIVESKFLGNVMSVLRCCLSFSTAFRWCKTTKCLHTHTAHRNNNNNNPPQKRKSFSIFFSTPRKSIVSLLLLFFGHGSVYKAAEERRGGGVLCVCIKCKSFPFPLCWDLLWWTFPKLRPDWMDPITRIVGSVQVVGHCSIRSRGSIFIFFLSPDGFFFFFLLQNFW